MIGSLYKALLLIVMIVFGLGCDAAKKDKDDDGGSDTPTTPGALSFSTTTSSRGTSTVEFPLPAGTTKFSVTARASGVLRLLSVSSDAGEEYLSGGDLTSLATEFFPSVSFANVPSRDFEPAVIDTRRYSATVQVGSETGGTVVPREGVNVTLSVDTKADGNLSRGRLQLNVFYVGDISGDTVSRDAVSSALSKMREIYSNEAGIELDITETSISGPNTLPNPIRGNSFYQSASGSVAGLGVNLFVGADVNVPGVEGEILGVSSSIPGPAGPSPRSVVAVSMLQSAGSDGKFSEDELRLLGETIAHECGHFMGLFHPVEINPTNGTVTGDDPLTDTTTCSLITDCVNNEALSNNLMFPFPVSNGKGGTVSQDQLTDQQRGVLNRYIAVT